MRSKKLIGMKLILFILLAVGISLASCTKDKILPTPEKPAIKLRKCPGPIIPRNHIDTSIDIKVLSHSKV